MIKMAVCEKGKKEVNWENSESNVELPEERKKERKHLEKKEWRYRKSESPWKWNRGQDLRQREWMKRSSEGGNEDKVKERRKRENIKKGKGNREVRKERAKKNKKEIETKR